MNKANGIVCLSYQYVKISLYSDDGTLIQNYEDFCGLSGSFLPRDVCFDNENCIIIVDTGGGIDENGSDPDEVVGQILRVNIFGKLLQVLVKGNKPTAVAVSCDDKLWIGYWDKNVTVYQLKNK